MIRKRDGKPVRKTWEEMCIADLLEIDMQALTEEELEQYMEQFYTAPILPTM